MAVTEKSSVKDLVYEVMMENRELLEYRETANRTIRNKFDLIQRQSAEISSLKKKAAETLPAKAWKAKYVAAANALLELQRTTAGKTDVLRPYMARITALSEEASAAKRDVAMLRKRNDDLSAIVANFEYEKATVTVK